MSDPFPSARSSISNTSATPSASPSSSGTMLRTKTAQRWKISVAGVSGRPYRLARDPGSPMQTSIRSSVRVYLSVVAPNPASHSSSSRCSDQSSTTIEHVRYLLDTRPGFYSNLPRQRTRSARAILVSRRVDLSRQARNVARCSSSLGASRYHASTRRASRLL